MSFGEKQLILVVDDEEQLRKLKRMLLERAGYSVLLAGSGSEALAISRGYAGDIHLLVSDIEMQGMSGLDLARRMTTERPGIRVLLDSGNPGYAEKVDFPFLAKPFLPHQLQNAVAQALQNQNTTETVSGLHPVEQSSISPIRAAPVEPIRPVEKRWRLPDTAAYWLAAAVILLAVVPLGLYQLRNRLRLPETLSLRATRGLVNGPVATSGRRLILNLDTSGLPQQDSYRIDILTEGGEVIATGRAPVHGSSASLRSTGLRPGTKLIRLSDLSGNLLREYTLQVRGKQVASP